MAARQEPLAGIEIRRLRSREQFQQTVELQRRIWGFSDEELFPVRLFIVVDHVGGLVHGAFDGERMIGFSVAVPGHRPSGESYLHSNMTGVLEGYQNRRIGRRLKLAQREDGLALGYRLIEWTFDPLEIRNAYFNIVRLGAVMRRYIPNCYGVTASRLHRGLPTDRLVAEWRLDDDRVRKILAGDEPADPVDATVAVPAGVERWEPERTLALQAELRERFLNLFENGYVVTGFRKSETGGEFLLTGPERAADSE